MTSIRRVLMSGDTVGGVFCYALDLARGLTSSGVHVVLATMGRLATPAQRDEASRIEGLILYDSGFALEWMDEPWAEVERAGRWLLDLEATFRPDVVHLNGYAHAALPFRAPVVLVGHSSVCSWWKAVKGERLPARYSRYGVALAQGLAAADVVVAPTATTLRALERRYGPVRLSRVIPNGVFEARFRPRDKERFVLAAGRPWDEGKNFRALAAVAKQLAFPIRLAGAQPGDPVPEGLVSLGSLDRDALAEVMGRAAIFAHPARYEPFGLAPLEAALSGAALVLGDIPSLREVWGDSALFVPPDDHQALASTLSWLGETPDARALWAERARSRARAFDAGAMTRAYLAVYESLGARSAITAAVTP
jgi:glycosyltransferase involved in cell wall biosynthesis